MAATSIYGIPYLELGDAPDIPAVTQGIAEATETELARVDADLVAVVRGRVKDNVGGTISTSEATEKTLTLSIPASWNTYDVDVFVAVRCAETSAATGNTSLTLRVRKTNTAGAEWGVTTATVTDTAPSNQSPASLAGFATNETATGTITVAFTAIASGNSGNISWIDLVMTAYAWRTS